MLNRNVTDPPYFSHMSTTKIRRITIDTASSMMSLNLMIIHVCTLHVALCDDCRFVQLYLHHFRLCSPTSSKENIFVFTLPILRSINFLQNSLIKRSNPSIEIAYFNDQFFFWNEHESLIGKIKTKECNLLLIGLIAHTYNEHTERRRRSLHLLIWHASNDNELRHAQIWYSWQFSSKWPTWFFSFIDKISR